MPSIDIGIRIDMESGLAYFGLEEVNQRIASGARLVEIRPGGAVMTEVGKDSDSVSLTKR